MSQIFKMFEYYNAFLDNILSDSDARTENWWLMKSPAPIFTILVMYLFFCTYAGPKYMKDKKSYSLKNVLNIYNVFQIIMSGYLVVLTIQFLVVSNYRFQCLNVNYSVTPEGIKEAHTVWVYFMMKVTELLDTVFFVLRKKNDQVTFLHVYHHTVMTTLAWYATKYSPGGQCVLDGGLNSLIHIFMYGYYFLAALGPQYQKYLWWKKYLTSLQLIQFSFIVLMNANCLFNNEGNYSKTISALVLSNCLVLFYMFIKFFYAKYINSTAKKLNKNM